LVEFVINEISAHIGLDSESYASQSRRHSS